MIARLVFWLLCRSPYPVYAAVPPRVRSRMWHWYGKRRWG